MRSRTLGHIGIVLFITLLVTLGMAAIWGAVSLSLRAPGGWMALVIAIDAAVLLRLAAFPRGRGRATGALVISLAGMLAGAFTVAALRIGIAFGTVPHEALWMIDPRLALTWWELNLTPHDAVALLAALPLAWGLAR